MRRTKKILVLILFVLIIIQFIQPAHNKSPELSLIDITKIYNVPDSVQDVLKAACYDCHSNTTNYPWYAYLQPLGWVLNNHIQNGKKDLNFSGFGSYSLRQQQSKLKEIVSQINDGEMPLSSYTWMHKNARLTKKCKAVIIAWAQKTNDSLHTKN